jgi:trigger factor
VANNNLTKVKLKIDRKDLEDGTIQLTVTIPAETTGDLIKGAAFILALQNKIDLSKVKMEEFDAVVIETVGEAQYKAFINHYAMSAMTPYAITEKNIQPIVEPEFRSSMEIAPDEDFSFVALVMPKPHYELSSYEPVTVKLPRITVTEEEIDAQLSNLAERSAKAEPDPGAVVVAASELVFAIDTKLKDSDEAIEHMTAERRVYTLGEDFLPKEFDDQLLGMKAGESRTFDFELPGVDNLDGTPGPTRTVTTTVKLTQVNRKTVPAITDAWVQAQVPEAKNVQGLREMLREQGTEYKTREQENMRFFLVASALAERFQGFIADEIYEHTRSDMLANLREQLKQSGMTIEQYAQSMGMEQQQFNMNFMLQVRETLRQSFALDALARHLKLKVEEEDREDALKRMAPGNEERARTDLEGSGRGYLLDEAALRTKANKWLVETAIFEAQDQ